VLGRSSSDKPGDRRDVSDMTGALDASIVPMLLTVNRQIRVKLYASREVKDHQHWQVDSPSGRPRNAGCPGVTDCA